MSQEFHDWMQNTETNKCIAAINIQYGSYVNDWITVWKLNIIHTFYLHSNDCTPRGWFFGMSHYSQQWYSNECSGIFFIDESNHLCVSNMFKLCTLWFSHILGSRIRYIQSFDVAENLIHLRYIIPAETICGIFADRRSYDK